MENEQGGIHPKLLSSLEDYRKFLISNIYLITVVVAAIIVVLVGIAIVKGRQTSSGVGVKPAQEAQQNGQSTNPSYVSPTFSPLPATSTKTLPETGSEMWIVALLFVGTIGLGAFLRKISSRGAES